MGLIEFFIALVILINIGRVLEIVTSFLFFTVISSDDVEEKTLANQEESFINGLIWADVGNDL